MATVRDWLQTRIGLSPEVQMHLLVTVIVIAGLWILERLVLALVYRRVTDPWSRYRWRKTITYITLAIAVMVIGREWLEGFKSLATFLGIVSAGFDSAVGAAGFRPGAATVPLQALRRAALAVTPRPSRNARR